MQEGHIKVKKNSDRYLVYITRTKVILKQTDIPNFSPNIHIHTHTHTHTAFMSGGGGGGFHGSALYPHDSG